MRVLLFIAGLLATLTAVAEEKIQSFESEIEIRSDGSMMVTETITVTAEGKQIRRGIYRDFPTRYEDRYGHDYRVDFDVLSVARNGRPEDWHTQGQSNGVRVYIGSADRMVPAGTHEYTLRYRTNYQLGYFEEFDELYWNVTGNGWAFAIGTAEAVVRLPEGVREEQLRIAAYTGRQGSSETAYRASVPKPGVVRFRTTRQLRPYEGLTIAVGFPKGVVDEPGLVDQVGFFLKNNAGVLLGLLGTIAVLWFYIWAWRRVGKDPEAGVIFPHYEPPKGYSPASLRYVWRMKYDATCLAAALVNLAVKGALSIHQKRGFFSKKYSLRKRNTEGVEFAPGETAVFTKLLGYRNSFEFDKDNHKTIKSALDAHEGRLARDYEKKYFIRNGDKIAIGLVSSIVVAGAMVLFGGMSVGAVILIVLLGVINLVFATLMKAPTMRGRKLMDHIEGLRLYLGVAERQDFERRHEPPQTFEEFERMLPYAVALDCASTWVDRFDSVLKELEKTGELRSRGWYTGHGPITAGNIAGSIDGLSSGFSSAISSASTPPGSSSGSGGGGFSGGGGGGGGGGGW